MNEFQEVETQKKLGIFVLNCVCMRVCKLTDCFLWADSGLVMVFTGMLWNWIGCIVDWNAASSCSFITSLFTPHSFIVQHPLQDRVTATLLLQKTQSFMTFLNSCLPLVFKSSGICGVLNWPRLAHFQSGHLCSSSSSQIPCICRCADVQVWSTEIQCVMSKCESTHTQNSCDYVCVPGTGSAVPRSIFLSLWLCLQAAEPSVLLQREVVIYRNSQNASWHTRPLASLVFCAHTHLKGLSHPHWQNSPPYKPH